MIRTTTLVSLAIAVLALGIPCGAQDSGAPAATTPENTPSSTSEVPAPKPDQSAEIVPGRLIHKVDPKYSKEAKKQKIQGSVVVLAAIDKTGNVFSVASRSGDSILARAVLDAVRAWKFEPYRQNGQPVIVIQRMSFDFALGQKIGELSPQLPPAVLAPASMSPNAVSTGGVFRVGGGVSAPRAIYAPEPEYSEEARQAKYQGVCVLSLVVGADGRARDITVSRSLGKGLDEKATEAVKQWKFQPGTKDGKPVAVYTSVEILFHLR